LNSFDACERHTAYVNWLGDDAPGVDEREFCFVEEELYNRIIQFDSGEVIVEVGVANFYLGGFFAFAFPTLIVIGIDNFSEGDVSERGIKAYQRTEQFKNLRLIVNDSVIAASYIQDYSVGLCFIDANHSYESVIADIIAWRNKVRVGGYLAFHDTEGISVRKAIDDSKLQDEFILDYRSSGLPNGMEIWRRQIKWRN
jgi:hypothetical protein